MLDNPEQYINHKVLVKRGPYEVTGIVRKIELSVITGATIVYLSSVIECLTNDWIGDVDIVWQKEYTIGIIE